MSCCSVCSFTNCMSQCQHTLLCICRNSGLSSMRLIPPHRLNSCLQGLSIFLTVTPSISPFRVSSCPIQFSVASVLLITVLHLHLPPSPSSDDELSMEDLSGLSSLGNISEEEEYEDFVSGQIKSYSLFWLKSILHFVLIL